MAVLSALTKREWDSRFFGIPTGTVTVRSLEPDNLNTIVKQARELGFRLVYIHAKSGPLTPPSATESQADPKVHLSLVDEPITFAIDYLKDPMWEAPIADYVATYQGESALRDQIDTLAIIAGEQSRFFRDPRFPQDAAERMYKRRVIQALEKPDQYRIFFARSQSGVIFAQLLTEIRLTEAGEKIGHFQLLSVLPGHRGTLITKQLAIAAFAWFRAEGISQAKLVTQRSNRNARRIYEWLKCYEINRSLTYHLWLEPNDDRLVQKRTPVDPEHLTLSSS